MMPLTQQEERARALLIEAGMPHEFHHVFDLKENLRISVDFLIFRGPGLVIECTFCSKKKGLAMSEVRRRCAYMDYRFAVLKSSFPNLKCGAFVEAPQEDGAQLAAALRPILRNSAFLARSCEELRRTLSGIGGHGID